MSVQDKSKNMFSLNYLKALNELQAGHCTQMTLATYIILT